MASGSSADHDWRSIPAPPQSTTTLYRPRRPKRALKPVRSEKPLVTPPAKADRTKQAVLRRVMRELYPSGPVGFTMKDQLRCVNDEMKKEGRQVISMSTLRRARIKEFGW